MVVALGKSDSMGNKGGMGNRVAWVIVVIEVIVVAWVIPVVEVIVVTWVIVVALVIMVILV